MNIDKNVENKIKEAEINVGKLFERIMCLETQVSTLKIENERLKKFEKRRLAKLRTKKPDECKNIFLL